jgi:hypothetical protein
VTRAKSAGSSPNPMPNIRTPRAIGRRRVVNKLVVMAINEREFSLFLQVLTARSPSAVPDL